MALPPARVSLPAQARKGEIVEIKALIRHPMETGYRLDSVGRPIPRDIVESFAATYGGDEVFRMDLTQGVAANPFIAFTTLATETAELVFTWRMQDGAFVTVSKTLTVVG